MKSFGKRVWSILRVSYALQRQARTSTDSRARFSSSRTIGIRLSGLEAMTSISSWKLNVAIRRLGRFRYSQRPLASTSERGIHPFNASCWIKHMCLEIFFVANSYDRKWMTFCHPMKDGLITKSATCCVIDSEPCTSGNVLLDDGTSVQ